MFLVNAIRGFYTGLQGIVATDLISRFGGYGFSQMEDGGLHQALIYSFDKEELIELVNKKDFFWVDYSAEEAQIRVFPEFVQEKKSDDLPFSYGDIGKWYTQAWFWGKTVKDLEDGVNEYLRIFPVEDGVTILPPRGYEHLDRENWFAEDEY